MLDTPNKRRYLLGAACTLTGLIMGLVLLYLEAITSRDFVLLTMSFLIAGFLVALIPNIAEISAGAFTLKLDRARRDAEATLETLRAPTPSLIAAPSEALEDTELRCARFLQLVHTLRAFGLNDTLSREIHLTAERLAHAQLNELSRLAFDNTPDPSSSLPHPKTLRARLHTDEALSTHRPALERALYLYEQVYRHL